MIEEKSMTKARHNLILENRKTLTVTGVSDVSGFDEQTVVMVTELGELTVKGDNLHINKFSMETGELNLDGEIYALSYAENRQQSGGFFSKIFR